MTLLLCPECCQWREPAEGRCPVCAGTLDFFVPDLSLETLADELGDLQELLGEAQLSRSVLPKRGQLFATTNGLLFVPTESRVIVFAPQPPTPLGARPFLRRGEGDEHQHGHWLSRFWAWLLRRGPKSRFDCERRAGRLTARDRNSLAELLVSDPGVLFWSRGLIATWRRQRGEWEFVRSNAGPWPERIAMRDRDGDRAVQTWLEATECPQPVKAR